MKLKTLTLATLSALYSMGTAQAVLAQPTSATPALQPMKLPSAEFLAQQKQRADIRGTRVLGNNGVNVALKRNSPAEKFVANAKDAQGEFNYIVETYGDTLVGWQQQTNQTQAMQATAAPPVSPRIAFQAPHLVSKEVSLFKQQDQVLMAANQLLGRSLTPTYRYSKVLNGFSLKMSQQEAIQLAKLPGIKKISKSKLYTLATDQGPLRIGADKVWSGDTSQGLPFQGEGIVVGIIDTGINTDHPSFAAVGQDGYQVSNPLGAGNYLGDCKLAEFADRCNDKLIGVYSYDSVTKAYSANEFQDPNKLPWDPNVQIRPKFGEDYHGHGSHTASTVAGNVMFKVPYLKDSGKQGDGVPTGFEFDRASGVAPHANIVAFQVCYPGGGGDPYAGCPGDALVKGIEDAVTAGVDVINFSIGGQEGDPWSDPIEQAFLHAHEAGVAVAVAAGNSGSDGNSEIFSYIDHSSPWLLNVAAATHGRSIGVVGKSMTNFSSDSTAYIPSVMNGKSLSGEITGNIVYARNFPDPQPNDAYGPETCNVPFPAGTFQADDIVLCDRGDIARVTKAENVKAGGAGGFILANTNWDTSVPEGMTFDDSYALPGIHINYSDAYTLKSWLNLGTYHHATITGSHIERSVNDNNADILANFSSRGPSNFVKEHLIPMVTAPGVDIYAANADDQPFTAAPAASDWRLMSGTSMASPHVAGALALVRQAHPDWTVSQVQNALQMTADQTVRYRPWSSAPLEDAGTYRAGSGRINVRSAIDTGLLLDESADNFRMADPSNGGLVHQLNMPELVNMHCAETCTWVRTFTATRDGDWQVSTETQETSIQLDAVPSRFSLKKGQTQSVVFTARILNSQSKSSNSEVEVWGSAHLTSTDPTIPAIYLPMAVKFDGRSLPDAVGFPMNRAEGIHRINNLMLPEVTTPHYSAATPVKATVQEITLPQKDPNGDPWNVCGYGCSKTLDATTHLELVEVPAGSSRLIIESLARSKSTVPETEMWRAGDADIYVGFDANGDGIPQYDEEAICVSVSESTRDYCNINNPQAGTYWVVVNNFQHDYFDPKAAFDTYRVATAVVGNDTSTALTAKGPATLNGLDAAQVDLHWNLADAIKGDVYYSMLSVGTDAQQTSNIAQIPVRLERGDNDVRLAGSQTQARAGQKVDMTLHVMENLDGYDRDLSIVSQLPANTTLVPGSVTVSNSLSSPVIESKDNGFVIKALQKNTANAAKGYAISTNQTDQQCHLPNYGQSNPKGYMDLWEFGFNPQYGGNWNENLTLQLGWYFGDAFNATLFNNQDPDGQFRSMTISPMGYMQLDDMPLFWPQHFPMGYQGFPDAFIAPFWRGIAFNEEGIDWSYMRTPFNVDLWAPKNNAGITMAFTADGQIITEWDNARTTQQDYDWMTGTTTYNDRDDSFDFEMFYNLNYRYGDGQYEIMMAYDNIDFGSQGGQGAIGIHGFDGYRGVFGPESPWLGAEFAFDNLKDKVKKNLVVCYDYVGPESSQFDVHFQVLVNNAAAGAAQPIEVKVSRTGLPDDTVSHHLNVPTNIQIGAIGAQQVDEDSSIELMVAYSDENTVANTITVSGAHVSGIAHANTPGSMVTITPDANFSGETQVTITVADSKNASDSASTSFKLTVNPMADAPLAVTAAPVVITAGATATLNGSMSKDPDGDALSYHWSGTAGTIANVNEATTTVSGLAAGEYSFELTVSDGTSTSMATQKVTVKAEVVPVESKSSSGGAAAGLLLLLPLAWRRRFR